MAAKTTAERKPEKHQCVAGDVLDELLGALDPLVTALLEQVADQRDVAKNINLLVQGAKAMAEIDDE